MHISRLLLLTFDLLLSLPPVGKGKGPQPLLFSCYFSCVLLTDENVCSRMQDPKGLSMPSSTTNLKSKEYPLSIPKQHITNEESLGFGLVSSDSLLNPSQESSYVNPRHYNSIVDFNDHKSQSQHSLRHFTDDWPKDQSNRATMAWPEELKSDWTQLSMSIPMATTDFSSTSSSFTSRENHPFTT